MPAVETTGGSISCQNTRRILAVTLLLFLAATMVWVPGDGIAMAFVSGAQGNELQTQSEQAATQKKTSTPADRVKALRQKAEKGNAEAQYRLAVVYRTAKGVPQNDAEAVKWYRAAAEQGHAGAQNNLGWMCYSGKGVPQDDAEAAKWFRKAAEQGDVDAQFNLGMMYRTAKGVPQDDVEAVKWFRQAAEQGDASAQYNLGVMYERGGGVPQDDAEAHMWLDLASARSSGEMQKKYAAARDLVALRMTAAQIAEARKKTREWMAAFRKRKR